MMIINTCIMRREQGPGSSTVGLSVSKHQRQLACAAGSPGRGQRPCPGQSSGAGPSCQLAAQRRPLASRRLGPAAALRHCRTFLAAPGKLQCAPASPWRPRFAPPAGSFPQLLHLREALTSICNPIIDVWVCARLTARLNDDNEEEDVPGGDVVLPACPFSCGPSPASAKDPGTGAARSAKWTMVKAVCTQSGYS